MKNNITQTMINKLGKVAVLMGGWSAEREISLQSGQAVYAGLIEAGVDAMLVDITKENILNVVSNPEFDRAFIALHGRGGEDGVIQSVLELAGIPYTGSGVLGSALAMDKLRTKKVLQASGLPTPQYLVLTEDFDPDYVTATLGLPIMVKPALEGSSIGMTKVIETDQLSSAFNDAAKYDGDVLAEQWIQGQEYTVSILGNEILPVIRLESPNVFYDFDAKYKATTTKYHCPAGLTVEQESQLQRLALAAFNALGAAGWGRVDILTDEKNHPWIIELNTVPGMTDHSLVPMAARVAGYSFSELVLSILVLSAEFTSVVKTEAANV